MGAKFSRWPSSAKTRIRFGLCVRRLRQDLRVDGNEGRGRRGGLEETGGKGGVEKGSGGAKC